MSAPDDDLVEAVAKAIYCDGTYAETRMGASDFRWAKTSEVQRKFCRRQARAAIKVMEELGHG